MVVFVTNKGAAMSDVDDFEVLEFLPYLLNQAAEESGLAFQRVYKDRYGMLRTEWRVLFHLGRHGALTARDIGLMAKIHKTKISRAVQKLHERRFLTRERCEEDRRAEMLRLTPAGEAAYRDLRGVARDYDRRLTEVFSAEEVMLLRRMLRQLGPKVD